MFNPHRTEYDGLLDDLSNNGKFIKGIILYNAKGDLFKFFEDRIVPLFSTALRDLEGSLYKLLEEGESKSKYYGRGKYKQIERKSTKSFSMHEDLSYHTPEDFFQLLMSAEIEDTVHMFLRSFSHPEGTLTTRFENAEKQLVASGAKIYSKMYIMHQDKETQGSI